MVPQAFGVNLFSRAFLKWVGCYLRYLRQKNYSFEDVDSLLEDHFTRWSDRNHPSRAGFAKALSLIEAPYTILETGTSAWGCDSTRLFDALVREFGGFFISVDIRSEASKWLSFQKSQRTRLINLDSVVFIENELKKFGLESIDFCYLDSFDIDFSQPLQSAKHHLAEFRGLEPFLRVGSIVMIDDQPFEIEEIPQEFHQVSSKILDEYGFLPGKATLILNEISNRRDIEIVWKNQSVILQFKN